MSITVMRSTLEFMSFCQMWPAKKEELNPSKWFFTKFVVILLSTLVNLTGSILHLFVLSLPNRNFRHVAEDLVTITAQIGVYYYITSYVCMQRPASRVYLKLSTFEAFGKPPRFDGHLIKLKYLAVAYKTGLNIVVISFFCEPILTRHICEKQNAAQNFEDICALVTPSWMPFNIQDFPNKQLFYLWQTYSIYWTYQTSASISFIMPATMEHVLVRIWHLKTMFKEAIETAEEEQRKRLVSKCLEYQNDIFNLTKDVDYVYKNVLFTHVLFSGVLFGIMGFSLLTVGVSIKTISLFVVWVAAAILSSFSAQRLYDESISVGEEIYNSRWYDRDYKFQRNLIVVIQRTQKPITVHAGPFATLSNVFVLAIFKTAYSYLTLLKATSQ